MIEPIAIYRLSRIAERGHGPFETGDLDYIIQAYRDMIETLEKLARTARSASDSQLAIDCLDRVRS